jgi:hypothetical protein
MCTGSRQLHSPTQLPAVIPAKRMQKRWLSLDLWRCRCLLSELASRHKGIKWAPPTHLHIKLHEIFKTSWHCHGKQNFRASSPRSSVYFPYIYWYRVFQNFNGKFDSSDPQFYFPQTTLLATESHTLYLVRDTVEFR